MYAIKIVCDDFTAFHQADEIIYNYVNYKDWVDLNKKMEEFQPDYISGECKGLDEKGYFMYLKLYTNPDSSNYKKMFIMPWSIVYIMQDGKTIEVIRIDEKDK